MRIRYILHSGFLLETEQSYYLFDWYKGDIPPLDTSKPIVVLSSHAHKDHYNPAVFSRLRDMGMHSISAVLADDIPLRQYPKDIETLCVHAGEAYTLIGGERLETLLSTDSGVAFLLTTDEGVIYHAGDLNDWFWEGESDSDNREMRENYRREINKLKGRSIDTAFVPLDPRLEAHYADGLAYFLSAVGARQAYPMHYWKKHGVIRRFVKQYPQYAETVMDPEKHPEGEQL